MRNQSVIFKKTFYTMEQCCRTCLAIVNLNPIFQMQKHHEKYSQVLLDTTGLQINYNDALPQNMCSACISSVNDIYTFRIKCQETQKILSKRTHSVEVKIEEKDNLQCQSIDISNLIPEEDNFETNEYEDNGSEENNENIIDLQLTNKDKLSKIKEKKPVKRTLKARKSEKTKEKEKEEIECEHCHKILTSKLSLRNHYKIHTGFDVVCEHCGKKFISRRLLLMHCKAKHGYEKTDKCSFCDYRASNAEQVKIHERLHTGEKPYTCATCGVGFHRRSSYLQHIAIHLPDKTVQCPQCESRFKSVTLMRIHASRHRAARYTYSCRVCAHSFARRRNVARHLRRIHDVQPAPEHIERTKCA